MGRRGPPPLPASIKLVRGTLRPCRESFPAPRTTPGVPEMPRGLDARERAEWLDLGSRLLAMGVLCCEHGEAFEVLVRTRIRYRRLARRVRTEGEVYTDETGILRRHPRVVSLERATAEYRRLAGEFGLTPTGCARVRGESGGTRVPLEDAAVAQRFFPMVRGPA